ncbi:MAG: orotidine-5'-phosphate decarboxylase [Chloroflexi bacterium]|nr:orotidine-5'-phosphate decarboxylase [Chloroflexota bacterium]
MTSSRSGRYSNLSSPSLKSERGPGAALSLPKGGEVAPAFLSRLLSASRRQNSLLCVGLDPQPEMMPVPDVFEFNAAIIEATADLVCSYKPNLAFYEALGIDGLAALKKTVEHIPGDIPVIGDAKRNDIGHSAAAYAKGLFGYFGFDAVTVNAYLGYDSVSPFLEYRERGVFLLCRTSNPGAKDFQDMQDSQGQALYQRVALKAREWDRAGNIGLVAGATYPEELKWVRQVCPDMPLLIPGIGAQGGGLEKAVACSVDSQGERAIIVSSRQVLYASKGKDFAQAARQAALKLRDEINRCRKAPKA